MELKYKYKVRFNLSNGINYKKWKIITNEDNSFVFVDPNNFQLKLFDCILKVQPATALKIFNGKNKSVCAWILCNEVEIKHISESEEVGQNQVYFNPRVNPNWVYAGIEVNNMHFNSLITSNSKVFNNETEIQEIQIPSLLESVKT